MATENGTAEACGFRDEQFVNLFYLLMRDYLTIGQMNKLVKDVLAEDRVSGYSDEVLLRKAESMVEMFFFKHYCVQEVTAKFKFPYAELLKTAEGGRDVGEK